MQIGSFLQASSGVMVEDLDGNVFYDLTGSYGVNVLGYDTYKACLAEGAAAAQALGPVLSACHPAVLSNVQRLRAMSGLDEVSFHMSGAEAVMQAVRLALHHMRRSYLVRFCGAHHGWWEDVQPAPGNPLPPRETYTLEDLDERSLQVLQSRRDIACVLVKPLQALHPNAPAPADSSLVDSTRRAGFDRGRCSAWLQRLREACTKRSIVLIFDEFFVGFRLPPGGADLFSIPSFSQTFGNVTAEALDSGLPVVAFDRAATAQLITHGEQGPRRPCDDALGFANAAVALATDADRHRRFEQAARARALALDWDSVVLRSEAVVAAIVHGAALSSRQAAAVIGARAA
ncbi:MAG: aminotransferase class III-fold pyridoxal phosphate-dependent enzyme [Rubrivivax sp.]|nr:aminotransferase class III-fold pyridoxal phosphate-dependent enzyme [Rubrivivax sp.]